MAEADNGKPTATLTEEIPQPAAKVKIQLPETKRKQVKSAKRAGGRRGAAGRALPIPKTHSANASVCHRRFLSRMEETHAPLVRLPDSQGWAGLAILESRSAPLPRNTAQNSFNVPREEVDEFITTFIQSLMDAELLEDVGGGKTRVLDVTHITEAPTSDVGEQQLKKLSRGVTVQAPNKEDVPFDVQHVRVIYYDKNDLFGGRN